MSLIPIIEFGVPGDKITVPRIGLGAMTLTGGYGSFGIVESAAILNPTKFGVVMNPGPDFDGDYSKILRSVCGTPEYVRKQFEKSIQSLGVD
ncbi:hypothetical protein IWW45_004757, partial [Coemansia sp. RSA 485]